MHPKSWHCLKREREKWERKGLICGIYRDCKKTCSRYFLCLWSDNFFRKIFIPDISLPRAKYETTSFTTSCVNISPKLAGSEVIPKCIQNSHKLSFCLILHNQSIYCNWHLRVWPRYLIMKSQTRNGNEIKHFDFLSLAYSFPETLFSIDAQKPMCLPLASGLNRRVRKLDLGSVCFAIVSARLTGTYCQHIFSL